MVRSVFQRIGYPLIVIGSGMVGALLLAHPELGTWAALVVIAPFAIGIGFLERVLPYTQAWQPDRHQLLLDFFYIAISTTISAQFIRWMAFGAIATAGAWVAGQMGGGIWPASLPLVAQVALAVLVADFGAYWAHRFMHLTESGWRAHAVHHSLPRMHFLGSGRTHPFNAFINHTAELGLLLFLGIGPQAVVLWTIIKAVNGILQHSNIDLTPGIVNRVLATNEVHWWHHAEEWTPSNSNFGNTTSIWDQLFGTYYMPAGQRPSTAVGLDDADIPEDYLTHLGIPFTLRRYQPKVQRD